MALEIRPVRSKKDIRRFIMFPFSLYAGNSCWVPPLVADEYRLFDVRNNPSRAINDFEAWFAWRDGKPVGRVCGIVCRPFLEVWKKKHGRFGYLEFVDDREVFDALMGTVEDWCRAKGMEALVGPMGFSDLDKEGLLVEGFDELGTLAMIYNHPYYPRHLAARGYEKDVDWVEYSVAVPDAGVPEKVRRVQELVFKRNKLRLLDAKSSKDYRPYIHKVFDVLQAAYKDLYGYVPLTPAQVDAAADQYFGYIDPRFTKIVLDADDRVAAVGIAMPSLSRALQKARGRLFPFGVFHLLRAMRRPEILDLYLVAVRPDLQNLGVNSILMNEITQNAIKAGIRRAETNGELEDNTAVQSLWKHYDARRHKRRRVYIRQLAE